MWWESSYRKMSDKELDDFVRQFPTHTELKAVIFEIQRRQAARMAQEDKVRHEKTQRLARWAVSSPPANLRSLALSNNAVASALAGHE
jgi:hypothetical protein